MNKCSKQSAGFSIVELLMAMALLALAAAAGYSALRAASTRLGGVISISNKETDERVALGLLSKDLRSAFLPPENKASIFSAHNVGPWPTLSFSTTKSDGACVAVTYFMAFNSASGKVEFKRINNGHEEVVCKSVEKLELQFFDGHNWQKEWNWDDENKRAYEGIRGLPLAVMVQFNETKTVVPVMTAVLNNTI